MPSALIIDDEPALTAIVGRFLERSGFDTDTATSGAEGLEKARSSQPDVIIVDVMMPEMNGYEVCQRLRGDPRTARAAILVLTARGQLVDRQMALQAGADAHTAKPFNGKALVEEIQALLDKKTNQAPPRGVQVTIVKLREGAGATTLAANLGLCLAKEQGCLAVVADLVLRGGEVSNRLGLPPTASWVESPPVNDDALVEHLLRHRDGLFVLPAPTSQPADGVDPGVVEQHLKQLRSWYDCVVVDTARDLGPLAPVLLRSSHLVLLLLTPDPADLRTARASLAAMKKLGQPALRIWPILNPGEAEPQAARQQAEEALGVQMVATLPWSPELCAQAMTRQQPVVLSAPDSPLSQIFHALAQRIVQASGPAERRSQP
jgi:DNA-binding response OmpR family regulator